MKSCQIYEEKGEGIVSSLARRSGWRPTWTVARDMQAVIITL
jgi:hypothetical protein